MTLKDAFGKTLNIATVSGGSSSNSDRDSISNSTVNTIINGTSDDDTINNVYYGTDYGTNVIINGLAGNDYINNTYDKVSINGGASNDTISNYPSYLGGYVSEVSVSGGAGNDYIVYNKYTKNMSINGGVGNDTIRLFIKNGVNTRDFNRRMKRRQKNILTAKYKPIKIEFNAGMVGNKIVLS